ncbi:MAG: hypothetical protein IPG45_22000 [Deltaproteobacteria bacterium]|nr:hypothetical protein [Deltaproteobacteria bacterium]
MRRWLLVCEGPTDHDVVTTLVDRTLHPELLSVGLDANIPHLRAYVGASANESHLRWSEVKTRFDRIGLRMIPGKFGGDHRSGSFVEARKALRLATKLGDVDAVILVRDQDRDETDRRRAFEEARRVEDWEDRAVIGVPIPEVEAWVLVGFQPKDDDETRRLAEERTRLGFDPTLKPEDLNPGRDHDQDGQPIKKAIKPILERLTGGDPERRGVCVRTTSFEQLRARGEGCGLTAFLDDLAARRLADRLGGPAA